MNAAITAAMSVEENMMNGRWIERSSVVKSDQVRRPGIVDDLTGIELFGGEDGEDL